MGVYRGRRVFIKRGVWDPSANYVPIYPGQASNFIKKETLAQMFSCEFCEIFKTTFFYRTPPVAASVYIKDICLL